ncbi:hypothetical protein [uncultured Desulfobulbus sp.]|uniref:hypothetical protein n=1 Tax=uncultured Desulfobulbus sp. TaxID=239745 RepID=UPI0029C6C481|nr:hypothetical protein [uncultured Desulfobulbus sp.]
MRTLQLVMITLFVLASSSICQSAGNLYIVGVDESGSYTMRPKVIKMVERLIHSLEPGGDTL